MESTTDPATDPTDPVAAVVASPVVEQISAEVVDVMSAVIEKGSDYVVSHADIVIDKVVSEKTLKHLVKSALRLALGCLKRPAKAPSTSSAPPSDEPPALELSPDAV
jgi:hypothetical protein